MTNQLIGIVIILLTLVALTTEWKNPVPVKVKSDVKKH